MTPLVWLFLGLVALASTATAQVVPQIPPRARGQEAPVSIREPDGSDPEMRELWERIKASPRCESTTELCEPRKSLYAQGGERLSDYLIEQYEASLREGYPAAHYLAYVAATGARTGAEYVLRSYREATGTQERTAALHGLVLAADPAIVDLGLEILAKEGNGERLDYMSITIVRRNLERLGTPHPRASAALRALEMPDSPKPWLREPAYRALNSLERKGVIPTRSAPADLLEKMPDKPE